MKSRYLTFLFCGLLGTTLWLSNSAGRATVTQSGSTGAPNEDLINGVPRTCGGCHAGGNFQITLALEVLDSKGTAVTKYSPGSTYTVKATVNSAAATKPKAYGCEIVCLNGSDADVNGWVNGSNSANTKIATGAKTKRTYLEQTAASTSNQFSCNWKAPAVSTGKITFYAACNGNNQNGGSGGDNGASTTLALSEGLVGTIDLEATVGTITILKNLIQDELTMNINAAQTGVYRILMIDMNGKMVSQSTENLTQGAQIVTRSTTDLPVGTYILCVQNSLGSITRKVVKL